MRKGHRPAVPETSFESFEMSWRVIGDHVDQVLSLMHDRQSPGVERSIARNEGRFEMLHARRVDVT